jgi:hypothetical protein
MLGFRHTRSPDLSAGTPGSTPGASKTRQAQRCGRISTSVIAPAPRLLDDWLMIVRSENDVIMQAEIG